MRKLLTRLLLIVALVLVSFPSHADIWLQGAANVMSATSGYGWQDANNPLQVKAASDGSYYIRTFGEFKLSAVQEKPNNYDDFNKKYIYFENESPTVSTYFTPTTEDNRNTKVGDDQGNAYVKLTHREDDNFDIVIQSEPFITTIPDNLFIRSNKINSWDNSGKAMTWDNQTKTFSCTFDYTAGDDFDFHFMEKQFENWSDAGIVLYPANDNTTISKNTPLSVDNVGYLSKDPYTSWRYNNSVTETIEIVVDFSLSRPTIKIKKYVDLNNLYVYSNNSGDGSWTGDTGGRKVTVNDPIVFTSNKPINFIFGPSSTYDKESPSDREELYGAKYNDPVANGSQRTAEFGNSHNFTIGSGQWEVTVTQFVPGESVTFSAIRNGDAPTDENSYIEYKIVGEDGSNLCTLQWDGMRNIYEGELPALSKGTKIRVWANKNNNSAESADYFGTSGDNTIIQAGTNRTDLVKDGIPLQINCEKEHHILVAVENGRYTAPVRIAFEEEIFPDRAGKVYLLGQFLNDSYESPAWEMKKQSDGTYFLDEFAMRKNPSKSDGNDFTHMEIAVYDQYGRRTEKSVKRDGFTVPRDYDRQPGRLCTATLDADMETILLKEQLRGDAASSVMPYIGIVGKNFRQSTRYNTRHDNGSTMGNTNLGWQEAYIEYGQFGSPLLDPNGNAYYNTVWPPRNNILMQAYFDENTDPLNISSDDLTMRRDSRGIKTGSEWKTELGYTAGTGTEQGKDHNGLCLVDDQKYAHYVIENLWVAGEYKIWTGFGGKQRTDDDHSADWDRFIFWGPGNGDLQKNPNQTFIIKGETNNFKTKDDGREYYNTMEFFIPVNEAGNDYIFDFGAGKEPRLYVSRAAGGAQLDAIARGNKLVGFAPKLNDLDGTGFHVTGYTVTRYAYDANTDRNNWLPCDKNRHQVEKKDAVVVSQLISDNSVSSNESFNSLFEKNFPLKISDLNNFGGVYTDDKTVPNEDGSYREGYAPYAPGRYAFYMEITFKNADGSEEKTAKVWSPYVEIFEELGDVHIYEAQLVELPEGRDFLTNYKYVTYQPDRTRFNRVAVQVDENGQPIELSRQEDDLMIEKLHEVYVKTGKWTNKVLLLTEDPEGFIGTKETFVMNKVTDVKTQIIDLQGTEAKKIRNWYAHIIDRGNVIDPATYEVFFSYKLTGGSGSGTEETVSEHSSETTYKPSFMLPYIGEPEITVVSVGGANDSFPTTYTVTHEHLSDADGSNRQTDVTSAHNELKVTVPVVMPNISEENGLRNAVYAALTVNVNGCESRPMTDAEGNYPAEYSLGYRHQNPYAWMSYDGSAWQPVTRSWNIGKSSYAAASAIRGIETDETRLTVDTKVNPTFSMPNLASNDIFTAQVENASAGSGYKYRYVAKLKDLAWLTPAEDYIFGDQPLYSDNTAGDLTYLCRVRSNGTGLEGTAQKLYGKVITPATAGNHILAEFYYNTDQPWGVDAQKLVTDWLRTLKIDFGRAYCFYSGENQQTGSGYVGLDGQFPDPAAYTAPEEAPKQRVTGVSGSDGNPSYSGASGTLAEGDNAYLLVPSYTMVNLGDENLDVAVDSVLGDTAGIESGKGYIDMLGNEGTIYAADGRKVYAGAARAELTPGVYMVTLEGRTFKVLVK